MKKKKNNCLNEENGNFISLLVGSDNYWQFVTGNVKSVCKKCKNLKAVHTKLGWAVQGPLLLLRATSVNCSTAIVLGTCLEEQCVSAAPTDSESIHVIAYKETELCGEHRLQHFERNQMKEERCYTFRLSWKENFKDDSSHVKENDTINHMSVNKGAAGRYQKNITQQTLNEEGPCQKLDDQNQGENRAFVWHFHTSKGNPKDILANGISADKLKTLKNAPSTSI